MRNLFGVYDNALPSDFCEEVIQRFEADSQKIVGRVGNGDPGGAIKPEVKGTTEILLNEVDGWSDVLDYANRNLVAHLKTYMQTWREAFPVPLEAEQFRVSRYNPGQLFNWHSDNIGCSVTRVITAQWYLNDVEQGGETEYKWYDYAVKPRQGRLLLAPVGWTFMHRGAPPSSGPKYIIITQLHQVQQDTVKSALRA